LADPRLGDQEHVPGQGVTHSDKQHLSNWRTRRWW
jgi:hypothetical protein